MELSELILVAVKQTRNAVDDYTRGARRSCAEDLAFLANKITKELPNIKLTPAESAEPPGPAGETPGGL